MSQGGYLGSSPYVEGGGPFMDVTSNPLKTAAPMALLIITLLIGIVLLMAYESGTDGYDAGWWITMFAGPLYLVIDAVLIGMQMYM